MQKDFVKTVVLYHSINNIRCLWCALSHKNSPSSFLRKLSNGNMFLRVFHFPSSKKIHCFHHRLISLYPVYGLFYSLNSCSYSTFAKVFGLAFQYHTHSPGSYPCAIHICIVYTTYAFNAVLLEQREITE